ncbi:hypothetical protein PR048_015955 [Dryococelus australis]|uniref:Uncharacterized protein n=1 Tax=Dryococelus australis TaxID=614101 RepID=A0ABQ9HIE3_9NEOP|nr:hypothetical protein PR048_015955 [Dryococelus australis]
MAEGVGWLHGLRKEELINFLMDSVMSFLLEATMVDLRRTAVHSSKLRHVVEEAGSVSGYSLSNKLSFQSIQNSPLLFLVEPRAVLIFIAVAKIIDLHYCDDKTLLCALSVKCEVYVLQLIINEINCSDELPEEEIVNIVLENSAPYVHTLCALTVSLMNYFRDPGTCDRNGRAACHRSRI